MLQMQCYLTPNQIQSQYNLELPYSLYTSPDIEIDPIVVKILLISCQDYMNWRVKKGNLKKQFTATKKAELTDNLNKANIALGAIEGKFIAMKMNGLVNANEVETLRNKKKDLQFEKDQLKKKLEVMDGTLQFIQNVNNVYSNIFQRYTQKGYTIS